jgi:hypothetical protein
MGQGLVSGAVDERSLCFLQRINPVSSVGNPYHKIRFRSLGLREDLLESLMTLVGMELGMFLEQY